MNLFMLRDIQFTALTFISFLILVIQNHMRIVPSFSNLNIHCGVKIVRCTYIKQGITKLRSLYQEYIWYAS